MTNTNNTLSLLQHELEFLDQGGYRIPRQCRQPLFCMETSVEQRKPLFFEESPSCPKKRHSACPPEGGCTLMDFVPFEDQHEAIPCRHIPLNDKGETIESLYRAGGNEKVEPVLRGWLVMTIQRYEQLRPVEAVPGSEKTASEKPPGLSLA